MTRQSKKIRPADLSPPQQGPEAVMFAGYGRTKARCFVGNLRNPCLSEALINSR